MIIVISSPDLLVNEGAVYNQLFESGLERLHLRKVGLEKEEWEAILQEVEETYHSRIVLHDHHTLQEKWTNLKLHYNAKDRNENKGFSSSVHSMEELKSSFDQYEHLFCSPVFDSISKEGYKENKEWQSMICLSFRSKAIALGGIDQSKLDQLKSWGYQNIAVLGAIWKQNDPVNAFKTLKAAWEKVE